MYNALINTFVGYYLLCRIFIGSFIVRWINKIFKTASHGFLFIVWYLPPSISSGVYRPLSFIKYAGKNDIELSCISGYLDEEVLASGKYLQEGLPDNIPIKRVKKININPSWRFFPRIQHNAFIDAIAIYFEAIKIYDKCPPKVIIATGPPFSDFIAATFLAKRYCSKLLLDYRDEWSESPFNHFDKSWLDKCFEKWCLKNTDAVIFTTESQIMHQLKIFSFLEKSKCHYIPNGWDQDFAIDNSGLDLTHRGLANEIIISFVGNLGSHTKPNIFFDCVSKVIEQNKKIKIKIRFIGYIGFESRYELDNFKYKDIVEEIGHVSKPEAIRYMRESTILLLITESDMSRYRPGKLYDYLAAKRPILVFGSEGEVKDVICDLNAGFYVKEGDWLSLEGALLKSTTYSWDQKSRTNIDDWMAKHERNVLAESFFTITNAL